MKGFGLTATATALVLLALAGRSHAQTVVSTSITANNVSMPTGAFNPIILYGLDPSFSATLTTNGTIPTSCQFMWMNGTQTISVLPTISQATTSNTVGSTITFSWTEPNLLAAGIYNSVHAFFPGCTVNGVTYLPTDSRLAPNYQFDAFVQILPASTALTASFTPFTLANFTQSIMVNLTNVNGTNQDPTGNSYEVITASNGNVIGNFSLVSTPLTANAVALTLPPTFNATQLLSTGSYTAVITYYPTINFTMPIPLTITFTITNVPVPSPPSPPVVPPPPPPPVPVPSPPPAPPSPWVPPPPSGNGSTTITVEVFYNQVTDFLKQCKSRNLYFVANVRSTWQYSPCMGPTDGTITFTDGTGVVLAQGPAAACGQCQIGLTVAFNSQGGAYGIGYGAHSVIATYSGSSNGYWLSSQAVANYVIPSTCNQQSIIQEIQSQQSQLDSAIQGDIANQQQWLDGMVQGAMGTMVNTGQSSSGTTVTYTPGGCTGGACASPCSSGNCGSMNPTTVGNYLPGNSLPSSVTGSLSNSGSYGTPGSYYGGNCAGGGCGAVNTIG